MADTRYLKQRGLAWNFNIKVPVDLVDQVGKQHITIPLQTRDLTKAQTARWPLVSEWMARFDVLRGNRDWTPSEIEEQAQAEFRRTLLSLEETHETEESLDLYIGFEADKIEYKRVSEMDYALTMARITAAKGRLAALRGDSYQPPATFGRRSIDPVTLKPVTAKKKDGGERFAEVARRYIDEVQRDPSAKLTEQTRGQYESVYRLFDGWADKPGMKDIDRIRATEFLDAIATLDPHWGRHKETKRRTFDEIRREYGNHETGLSNRTVNRYMTALSLVWKWSIARGIHKGENPWTGQSRRTGEKRKTQKFPFTNADLKTLLGNKPEVKPDRHTSASTLPWLCLIAAYSGMRLNEICERRVSDLRQEKGIWYFDVINAKTEAGDRRVPIHSKLIEAGLLEFAAHHRSEWLFPALKPGGPDSKRSWYISKRFTIFRRERGVVRLDPKTKKDRIDFHSFRRSAIQVLERARFPQTEVAQVVGHDRQGITFDIYNPEGLDIPALKEIVEAIRYPDLDGTVQQAA